jgi:hypothetical protein
MADVVAGSGASIGSIYHDVPQIIDATIEWIDRLTE